MYQGYLKVKAKGNVDFNITQESDGEGGTRNVFQVRRKHYAPWDGKLDTQPSDVRSLNLQGLLAAKEQLESDLADCTALLTDAQAYWDANKP